MPAMAADMTPFYRAPLEALPFNWTGVYIGLSAVRGRTSNQTALAQAARAVLWGASMPATIGSLRPSVRIPVHRGQSFRRIADSVPVIADSC